MNHGSNFSRGGKCFGFSSLWTKASSLLADNCYWFHFSPTDITSAFYMHMNRPWKHPGNTDTLGPLNYQSTWAPRAEFPIESSPLRALTCHLTAEPRCCTPLHSLNIPPEDKTCLVPTQVPGWSNLNTRQKETTQGALSRGSSRQQGGDRLRFIVPGD